jgi:HK97 family phage major capsid protein
MTIEAISQELDKRDSAIKTELDALQTKNAKLTDKNMMLNDRLVALEQRDPDFPDNQGGHKYDIMKAVKHVSDPSQFRLDGLEAEMHQEFQRKMPPPMPGAVWVPLGKKSVDYNTVNFNSPLVSAGGSNLVPQELGSLIDTLYQRSTIMGLNPTRIPVVGDLDLPKKLTNSSAYWVSGEGEAITPSTPTFGKVEFRPKYLTGLVNIYARMLTQTGGAIEGIVAQDLMDVLAVELDRAAIQGSGSGSEPTGIINTSNVLTDTWTDSPATFTWDDALELERLLLANNAHAGNMASVMDTTTFKGAKGTTKVASDAGAGFIIEGGQMNGFSAYATNNCPANTIVHGNWEDLVIAEWGMIAIATDPYTNFNTGSVQIRAMMPLDIGVRHPESFVVSTVS